MTQQNNNRDLVLDLYRSMGAQDPERVKALVSPRCLDKIIDGRLVEQHGDFDTAGLMQQLTQGSAA